MKKISAYTLTKEERDFLFKNKVNAGEGRKQASKDILKDRAYLKKLKVKNYKIKHTKPKLNFKLEFEEMIKNGNNTN